VTVPDHILHIDTGEGWGGGQNQVRLLIEGLLDRNFRCSLITPSASELSRRVDSRCRIISYSGNALHPVNIVRLARLLGKDGDVSLIDAHDGRGHTLAVLAKLIGRKQRDVKLTVHRRIPDAPSGNLFTRFKYRGRTVDLFVAISNAIKDSLRRYGVSDNRLTTVYSCVDERPYSGVSRDAARAAVRGEFRVIGPLICAMARLAPDKGHRVLIAAAKIVHEQTPDVTFVIAGIGSEEAHLRELIQTHGMRDIVHLAGFRRDVPQLMLAADLFVHPSLEEGLGTIVLEAGLAGVPIVASAVGGIPEFVTNEVGGLLVPPGDPAQLAAAIQRTIRDRALAARLASANHDSVTSRHHRNAMVDGNISVYRRLLQRS